MDSTLLNFKSKDRSTNFSNSEVSRLQTLIEKYKHIIMCKKTDGTSVKQKDHTWSLIEKEFNAISDTKRTVKQLKYKFENMKKVAKKEASKERLEMSRTGGGPPPPQPSTSDDPVDWIRSMMPSSIDGNESIYDDDVIPVKAHVPKMIPKSLDISSSQIKILGSAGKEDIIEIETDVDKVPKMIPKSLDISSSQIKILGSAGKEDIIEIETDVDKDIVCCSPLKLDNVPVDWVFDTSTPHSSLKRPVSSPLKRVIKRKKENLSSRQKLHDKKIHVLDELQELELQRLRESIAQQKAEHDQTIRHREEKHQFEIEKIKLEIKNMRKSASTMPED